MESQNMIGNFNGDTGEPVTYSEMHWQDYLALKNYNTDINKMCEICIQDQINKFGARTIKCKGLMSRKQLIGDEHAHMLTADELDLLEQAANPYHWAEKNIDVGNMGSPKRIFVQRWYQEFISRCSSTRKTIRCGRRAGKSYSLALNMLHKCLTNKNYYILLVTPFDVQSEELINLILQFLYNMNPDFGTFEDLVVRSVQSPNRTIDFANGSRIKAFTTGTSGASSVRGQKANLIVLDEVDYMTSKDFNSIIAILADKPDTEMWVASTPDGEKQLYNLSKKKRYKEFHFPSFVLPHYNEDLDNEFRESTDSMGYVQEIMAEFGASKHGVFQKYYIDLCTKMESTIDATDVLNNRSNYLVTMGCDWNHDKIGTRIVSLAYHKGTKQFAMVEKTMVSKEGWTQTTAMKAIIDLNRKWEYDHLYVDRGYGSTQIEVLTKHGYDNYGLLPNGHPDLKLAEIKGIDFNSTLEIPDPYTGQPIKKHMKPFMVNNMNKLIERQLIKLYEKEDRRVIEQLKGYEEKRGVTGRPVYKAASETVGDHDLDALMLAALAYNLEYSDLISNGTLDIRIVKKPENKDISQEDIFNEIATGTRRRAHSSKPKSRDMLSRGTNMLYNTPLGYVTYETENKVSQRSRLRQGASRRAVF